MAVRCAMVEVEHNNGEHNGQGTHEHDRGEVRACHVQHNHTFITTSIVAFNSRSLFEFVPHVHVVITNKRYSIRSLWHALRHHHGEDS